MHLLISIEEGFYCVLFCVGFSRLTIHRILAQKKAQVAIYTTRNVGGTNKKLTDCAGIQNRQLLPNVGIMFDFQSWNMSGCFSKTAIPEIKMMNEVFNKLKHHFLGNYTIRCKK